MRRAAARGDRRPVRMVVRAESELPRSIGFLLIPGFSMLALCSALEPLRLANQLLGERFYSWTIFTRDGLPVRASCGMSIPADSGPDGAAPPCLIVIAGFDPWPQDDRRLKSWLRLLDRRGSLLGAVDTGAYLLASAELLGERATVLHWESAAAFSELFPDIPVSEKLYDIDGNRLLCAGGAAVLDMMIDIVGRTHGPGLEVEIAERLLYRRQPAMEQVQRLRLADRVRLSDPDVLRAIQVMERHIETTASIAQIAHEANVSKRTLERKFRHFFDLTPTQAYLECRLVHARQLLRHCDIQIREVALACGFSSISYFCRSYKRKFHVKPGQDRRLDYALVQADPSSLQVRS